MSEKTTCGGQADRRAAPGSPKASACSEGGGDSVRDDHDYGPAPFVEGETQTPLGVVPLGRLAKRS